MASGGGGEHLDARHRCPLLQHVCFPHCPRAHLLLHAPRTVSAIVRCQVLRSHIEFQMDLVSLVSEVDEQDWRSMLLSTILFGSTAIMLAALIDHRTEHDYRSLSYHGMRCISC